MGMTGTVPFTLSDDAVSSAPALNAMGVVARDALNSSQLAGLRLVFFSTDRAVLERMTRLNAAAFYCAKLIDMRKL